MTLDTALIAAIVALAGAIGFLYMDNRKSEKAHAAALKALAEAFAASMDGGNKVFAATTKENNDLFSKALKEVNREHADQEERIHSQHQKVVEDMVQDHRREMTGMVDRVLAATKNDKEHDRDVAERMLRLSESLERRAQWKP
jgi:uncharacterized membrane protein